MIAHSQLAPLPIQLPFRIVSKTIGQGAYACIKKAAPLSAPSPVFAVKFIHREFAVRHGRLSKKQLDLEVSLHSMLAQHVNIVQFYNSQQDDTWRWIAMELAEGGDLFDKIESDVGVGEDVAHFYFTQLISAVGYMHSKGIAHRDIKPENILLSAEGDLKIADFGLATMFQYKGTKKVCATSCGSPPYTAPEVVICDARSRQRLDHGYSADFVDIWSCGVVLFVLLVGNTPWDEPLERSYEFADYVKSNGYPHDDLWKHLPRETLSLLRAIMRIDPKDRASLPEIRRHPWFTRHNKYLTSSGRSRNPLALATDMFESMKIDFSQDPMASQKQTLSQQSQPGNETMDIDSEDLDTRFASTQPQDSSNDIMFDRERPPQAGSQPTATNNSHFIAIGWDERLADEPSLSQFSATPQVPLTKTQYARQFRDIVPSHSLTRFFSLWALPQLHAAINEALNRLGVLTPMAPFVPSQASSSVWIKIRPQDSRSCLMVGDVIIESMGVAGTDGQMLEINFVKSRGDPVEWRRLFKKVVVMCKAAVYRPDDQMNLMLSQSQG